MIVWKLQHSICFKKKKKKKLGSHHLVVESDKGHGNGLRVSCNLILTHSVFRVFDVKINHFEAHLMGSSREVPRMAIQFEFLKYIMLEILNGFSLLWVLMERHSKSTFLYLTLKFELEWINISSRHSIPNFAHSFDFPALPILRQISNCRRWFLLWCELISIYTLKNQWITIVSKIWVGMSTTNIHLLPFSHLQKRGLECRYIRTHTEEKLSKISNITFAILPFSHANTSARLPSWALWSLFLLLKLITYASKWFILTQRTQNLQYINIKCVAYAQPITLPLNWSLEKNKNK